MNLTKILLPIVCILGFICLYNELNPSKHNPVVPPVTPKTVTPRLANVTVATPNYLSYSQIVGQLNTWHKEAPDLTEVGTYGKSAANQDLYYIRVTNLLSKSPKKTVMITACIHGNEPLSASTVLAYVGNILSQYGKKEEVTTLLDTRDVYFVPVISPDSHPNSREVNGVDPNRNFPGPQNPNRVSVPPVKAIQEFHKKIKPAAVISGHTFGRVYLYPYGDTNQVSPNDSDYQKIIGTMTKMSNYRMMRCCFNYGRPIFGTEVDWYYRNGSFAVVMEFGTHQRIPVAAEISDEFNRTYSAVLYFLKEAPLVNITAR